MLNDPVKLMHATAVERMADLVAQVHNILDGRRNLHCACGELAV